MPNPLDDAIEKVITIGCKCESTIAQHREAVDKLVQLVRTRTLEEAELGLPDVMLRFHSPAYRDGFNACRSEVVRGFKSLAPDSSGEGSV